MTRRLLILAAFLLAGAVVNVALAWGCYSRADPPQQATLILDREMALWKKYADRGWPPEPTQATYGRAFGFETSSCSVTASGDLVGSGPMGFGESATPMNWYLIWEDRAGWPAYALLTGSGAAYLWGLVPARPLWPGFIVNTLFYAAILWMLMSLLIALRRHHRVRRGLCPACAYPTGESAMCSECGNALREPAQ